MVILGESQPLLTKIFDTVALTLHLIIHQDQRHAPAGLPYHLGVKADLRVGRVKKLQINMAAYRQDGQIVVASENTAIGDISRDPVNLTKNRMADSDAGTHLIAKTLSSDSILTSMVIFLFLLNYHKVSDISSGIPDFPQIANRLDLAGVFIT